MRVIQHLIFITASLLFAASVLADTQVNVVGLFNGKPVLEIEGKRRELAMGQAAAVAGTARSAPGSVTLYADSAGHHFTEGQINGVTLKFIVDTGATTIAMNSGDAKYAGIDYKRGERIQIQTASGIVIGYRVVINTLKLGSMVMNQVDATVLEGGSPAVVLLGMSALNRLEMKREGIALTLTKKY